MSALFFDIDGTILSEITHEIPESALVALRKAQENGHKTFINTGRGAQVNEPDLIRFLAERPDVTALLDVTYPEPPAKDSPLFDLENVILTPHIAGSMGNEVWRMAEYMLKEFRCYISGEPTKYSVSLKMLETMA